MEHQEKNFRLSAKSFIVNDGKILVLKRAANDVHKPNIWEFPGGRLDLGEDPREGLKRETKEETGLDIDILHPLSVKHFTREDGQIITMLIFLCKTSETNLDKVNNIKLSEEHSEFVWVPIEKSKDTLPVFFHPEVDIFKKLDLQKYM
ncbi:MAG: NUDIX hydrolase [Candidatus Pacearchaeota archaeon]|nr:NUDIX hydrolase [Candidatus Pacearchaeota archaeon]